MTQITKPKHGKFQPQTKRISFQDALNILHGTFTYSNNHMLSGKDNTPGKPQAVKPQ